MPTTSSTSTPSAGSEPRYAALPKANTPPSLPIAQNPELLFVEPPPADPDAVRVGVAGAAAGVGEDDVVPDPGVAEATGDGELEAVAAGPVVRPVVGPVVVEPVVDGPAGGVPPLADGGLDPGVPAVSGVPGVVVPLPPGEVVHVVVVVVAVAVGVVAAGVAAVGVGHVAVGAVTAAAVAAGVVAVVAVVAFAVVPAVPDAVVRARAEDGPVAGSEGVGRVDVGIDPAGVAAAGPDPFPAERSPPAAGCIEVGGVPECSLELRAGTLDEVRAPGCDDDGPGTVHRSVAAPATATTNAASTRSGRARPRPGAPFEE